MNQARTETEAENKTEIETARDSRPTGVSEHDDHHPPRKHDPRRTIMVVCGFLAALAMLIGLNMK
ncbi:MAG TPA: hypothetical protein VIU64_02290 [Polyangia bacterium]